MLSLSLLLRQQHNQLVGWGENPNNERSIVMIAIHPEYIIDEHANKKAIFLSVFISIQRGI